MYSDLKIATFLYRAAVVLFDFGESFFSRRRYKRTVTDTQQESRKIMARKKQRGLAERSEPKHSRADCSDQKPGSGEVHECRKHASRNGMIPSDALLVSRTDCSEQYRSARRSRGCAGKKQPEQSAQTKPFSLSRFSKTYFLQTIHKNGEREQSRHHASHKKVGSLKRITDGILGEECKKSYENKCCDPQKNTHTKMYECCIADIKR